MQQVGSWVCRWHGTVRGMHQLMHSQSCRVDRWLGGTAALEARGGVRGQLPRSVYLTHTLSHTHSLSRTFFLPLFHTHSLTLTHFHARSLTRPLALSLVRASKQAHTKNTHTNTPTHPPTHTHTQIRTPPLHPNAHTCIRCSLALRSEVF